MDERGAQEAEDRREASLALQEILRPLIGTLAEQAKKSIPGMTPENARQKLVPGTSNVLLSRVGRIMAVLNMGNKVNRQRLLAGHNWSDSDARAIIDSLSKEDMDMVQAIWDNVDRYWERIAATERRVGGLAPTRVTREPLETRHGIYAGGYFPIVEDPILSEKAAGREEFERQLNQGTHGRSTTARSFAKERFAGNIQGKKLQLDIGVLFNHLDGVIHYLNWYEWGLDANRILHDKRIEDAIKEGYGYRVYETIISGIKDIAVGEQATTHEADKFFRYMRSGSSVAAMGWKSGTAILQLFGLTQSISVVGAKWIGLGLGKWMQGAAHQESVLKDVLAMSKFMKTRGSTMNRDIGEIRNRVVEAGLMTPVRATFFSLIVKMQQIVDVITWLGAYAKFESEGKYDQQTLITMADGKVIDSQGSGMVKDLAAIERGPEGWKAFTQFGSFFNSTYQLGNEMVRRRVIHYRGPADILGLISDTMLNYIMPSVMTKVVFDGLRGDWDEDEDWGDYLWRIAPGAVASYVLNTMYIVREFAGMAEGYTDYEGPAGIRGIPTVGRLIGQAAQLDLDMGLARAGLETGGIFFKLPSGAAVNAIYGVLALHMGVTENPAAPFMGIGPEKRKRVDQMIQGGR